VRRSNSLLGLIGLVLLLFAGIAGAFTGGRTMIDVVFIAAHGLVGLFCLVAYLSAGVEQVRSVVSERSTRYGANVILGSVIFVAVLALLNYLGARHSKHYDLTEQGVYSLSEQSISVLKALDKDLKIEAFVEGGLNPQLRDLFENYARYSDKVKFQLIDPDKQPELAEKYQIKTYNTVRLEYGNESTTITQPNEETLTNAVIKITRGTRKVVCLVEGHGEPDTDDVQNPKGLSSFKTALTNENYEVKSVLLASMEAVPADCSAVIVAGPQKPFLPSEVSAIEKYLDGGGRTLFFLPPRSGEELSPLLAAWGVQLGQDIVVDQVVRLFQGPALGLTPLANTYGAHEITRDFKQRTIFPLSRSVRGNTGGKSGLQAVELVKTSPSSWGETDIDGIFQRSEAVLDPNADLKGPVPVAVAVEAKLKELGKEKDGEARLVVIGSSEFAGNREFDGTYFNRDLAMNAVGWLVGQSDLVSIRPRGIRASRAQFTPEQSLAIFYVSVLLVPELLLLAGIVVWWRRE
jgi:ABC-type uncharacterized transport system involved in gliding motility auxiliary subunit